MPLVIPDFLSLPGGFLGGHRPNSASKPVQASELSARSAPALPKTCLTRASVAAQGYEPVVLVLAKDVPWFDERFRGPLGARTAHALDMSQYLTFEVNPNEFVMHMPFPRLEAAHTAAEAIYDQV